MPALRASRCHTCHSGRAPPPATPTLRRTTHLFITLRVSRTSSCKNPGQESWPEYRYSNTMCWPPASAADPERSGCVW
eukprot:9303583-Pyramimonas_sp.AAC.1